MINQNYIRWSGLVLLIAGILYLPGIFHPPDTPEGVLFPAWIPVHTGFFIHHLLLVFGLIGLYFFIAEKSGRLGLIAFIMTLSSNVMFPTLDMVQITLYPILAKYPETQSLINPKQAGMFGVVILVSVIVALIGNILLGIAIIRARVMSRWIGSLFIVGWICFFIGSGSSTLAIVKPFGIVLSGIGYIWGGYAIWKVKD
ncbi:MAG: hypothetical protein HOE30_11995 [Deltaproteobacteria bacterium]|jgi:hypothetical protein|nr:hypothetical protein [Deltaproteobacteria bacterium]MBT4267452.1 hypothetical protein [Deltaproteobacteria bacterium]MBT4637489.1 hypothetical protein [Deltaproteobacteria bacterium]MBT6500800.1 hypothetical protein [Deltaproteobacteria bacterium]MBT6612711.1 hypothetical protein [Deltaproteobacteria bacterium]